jgi:hypothetical protein
MHETRGLFRKEGIATLHSKPSEVKKEINLKQEYAVLWHLGWCCANHGKNKTSLPYQRQDHLEQLVQSSITKKYVLFASGLLEHTQPHYVH